MYIELFTSADGPRWRLRGGNHEILATSESYADRDNACGTADVVASALSIEVVDHLDG